MNKNPFRWTLYLSGLTIAICVAGNVRGQEFQTLDFEPGNSPVKIIQTSAVPRQQPVTPPDTNVQAPPIIAPNSRRVPEAGPVDQRIEVVERLAGWNGAGYGLDIDRLSENLRSNWVMVDSNGGLGGRVNPIGSASLEGLRVHLLNNGRVVTGAGVDENGEFKFNNVVEGAYSLVGYGPNSFFAFGFNVLSHSPTAKPSTPTRIEVAAFQNRSTINNDWIRYFAPGIKFRVFGRYSVREGSDDPDKLYGFDGLGTHHPESIPATSIGFQPSVPTADGRFIGRVHQLNSIHGRPVEIQNSKVMLLYEDQVVAATTTDRYGVFEFADVPAGDYGLVAASVDGLGMVGVSVAEPAAEGEESIPIDFSLTTSETIGWLNNYATEEAYRRAILAPRPAPNGQCKNCNGLCSADGFCNQCGMVCGQHTPCHNCGAGCGANGQCNNCGYNNYDYLMNQNRQRGHMQKFSRSLNNYFDSIFYPGEQQQSRYRQPPCDYTRGR